MPPPDFRLCIHHDGLSACSIEHPHYPQRSTMSEIESHMTVTLCCEAMSSPA
jgi:hypothetical protein